MYRSFFFADITVERITKNVQEIIFVKKFFENLRSIEITGYLKVLNQKKIQIS